MKMPANRDFPDRARYLRPLLPQATPERRFAGAESPPDWRGVRSPLRAGWHSYGRIDPGSNGFRCSRIHVPRQHPRRCPPKGVLSNKGFCESLRLNWTAHRQSKRY
jgi:hypothetical protein